MVPESICVSTVKSICVKLALLLVAYFTPIAEMVIVMLIFLLLDTISDIWASLKKGVKLKSHKLRKTVYKIVCYTVAVMLPWMMEKTFSLGWSNLASLVCGFICFVELKSIFENVTRITGAVFKQGDKYIWNVDGVGRLIEQSNGILILEED